MGAGTGSYEPDDRYVIAVEPSATMRAQRPRARPAIAAAAEALPLDDNAVDAAMAIATVHHWADMRRGLAEMRRVARGPVVVLTFDAEAIARFWLVADYLPELGDIDRARFPTIDAIAAALGGARVEPVAVALDCRDGFIEAYYARPEAFLDAAVRAAQSPWPLLPAGTERRGIDALAADLASGKWDERHGELRSQREYQSSLRLVIAPGAQYDCP